MDSPDAHTPRPPEGYTGPEDLVGRVLGNCRIERHVARGGMGDIYAADHLYLGRPVAIKVPRFDDARLAFNQDRLLSEARCLAAVSHPNLVAVYDMGLTDEGLGYLVMELLDGSPLDRVLDRTPLMMFPEVLHITKEVARAIAACHRSGIICGDIKPDNIMVTYGPLVDRPSVGEVWTKIIDLGTARSVDAEQARTGPTGETVMGTPAYMSPEMAVGDPLDPRADIYSLGILLYELVAGRPPFVHPEPEEVMRLQVYSPPPPVSAHRQELQPGCDLDKLLVRCLAKDPAVRVQSALGFLDALDRAARSLPQPDFRPKTRPGKGRIRPSRKRRTTAILQRPDKG